MTTKAKSAEPAPEPKKTPPTEPVYVTCQHEIEAVLEKHRCLLIARIETEPAGTFGEKAIVRAVPVVVPNPRSEQ